MVTVSSAFILSRLARTTRSVCGALARGDATSGAVLAARDEAGVGRGAYPFRPWHRPGRAGPRGKDSDGRPGMPVATRPPPVGIRGEALRLGTRLVAQMAQRRGRQRRLQAVQEH